MAGTILSSSPHYFSAVEDYHAFWMKNWLALATLRSKQNLPKSHCLYEQTKFLQPAYVEKIPYSMPIDSWHPCTESSNEFFSQAYMNHQRKSYKLRLGPVKPAFLDGSPGPKHNKPTHHQSKPKPMQEGPHCHGSPFAPHLNIVYENADQLANPSSRLLPDLLLNSSYDRPFEWMKFKAKVFGRPINILGQSFFYVR